MQKMLFLFALLLAISSARANDYLSKSYQIVSERYGSESPVTTTKETSGLEVRNSERVEGRVGGPSVTHEKILANDVDVYRIRFYGGSKARVTVSGDGDTDLDLYVYDSSDKLVAKDDDSTDYCIVSWTPSYTSTYKIRIVNRGSIYNNYTMRTN